MIEPIQPYVIRGVIWYQRESDRNRHELYANLFTDIIQSCEMKTFLFIMRKLPLMPMMAATDLLF